MRIQSILSEAYADLFPQRKPADVFWSLLPAGQSYVAGKSGEIFLALVEVEEGLDQTKREAALLAFTKSFADSLGISFDKPMVTFIDSPKLAEYMQANRNRIRWLSKPGFILSTILHAAQSKKKHGFTSIRTNL